MKRSTAVRHLVEMAGVASDLAHRLHGGDLRWPLAEFWLAGDLLDGADAAEDNAVILMLDRPVEELPWVALDPEGEWVGEQLRLGKRPFDWWYRPAAWPAWNAAHRRVARIWSRSQGLDEAAVETLRAGGRPAVVEPTPDELRAQLRIEHRVSSAHLRNVVDSYWDRAWRRRHSDPAPEEHLWRAASGLVEIEAALAPESPHPRA